MLRTSSAISSYTTRVRRITVKYNDLFLKGTLFDQIVIGYDNLFLLSIIIDQLIIGYFNLFLLVVTYSIG